MTSYGEICPKNSPKRGVNRQLQAKTPKSIHRNISRTINPTNKRFEDQVQTTKGTSWVVRHYPKANITWLMAAILKIDMILYFGGRWSNLDEIRQPVAKQHADYGEMVDIETGSRIPIWRTFVFQNGSSYISAVNWGMLTKFGWLIDIDLPKAVRLTNTIPEVVLSGPGRHLKKWIWRHISAVGAPIWTKCGSLMQNNTQITVKWSTSKPEVEFQDGGRLFLENGSSYISAVNDWDISTKFGLLIDSDLPNTVA